MEDAVGPSGYVAIEVDIACLLVARFAGYGILGGDRGGTVGVGRMQDYWTIRRRGPGS